MKDITLPPFTASALVVGSSFRISAGQGLNFKAIKITPYLTSIGPKPRRTMLEVEAEGFGGSMIMELDTVLYHAK